MDNRIAYEREREIERETMMRRQPDQAEIARIALVQRNAVLSKNFQPSQLQQSLATR